MCITELGKSWRERYLWLEGWKPSETTFCSCFCRCWSQKSPTPPEASRQQDYLKVEFLSSPWNQLHTQYNENALVSKNYYDNLAFRINIWSAHTNTTSPANRMFFNECTQSLEIIIIRFSTTLANTPIWLMWLSTCWTSMRGYQIHYSSSNSMRVLIQSGKTYLRIIRQFSIQLKCSTFDFTTSTKFRNIHAHINNSLKKYQW